jgi:hypothetical protein
MIAPGNGIDVPVSLKGPVEVEPTSTVMGAGTIGSVT